MHTSPRLNYLAFLRIRLVSCSCSEALHTSPRLNNLGSTQIRLICCCCCSEAPGQVPAPHTSPRLNNLDSAQIRLSSCCCSEAPAQAPAPHTSPRLNNLVFTWFHQLDTHPDQAELLLLQRGAGSSPSAAKIASGSSSRQPALQGSPQRKNKPQGGPGPEQVLLHGPRQAAKGARAAALHVCPAQPPPQVGPFPRLHSQVLGRSPAPCVTQGGSWWIHRPL